LPHGQSRPHCYCNAACWLVVLVHDTEWFFIKDVTFQPLIIELRARNGRNRRNRFLTAL
jgi:hypothetical protein